MNNFSNATKCGSSKENNMPRLMNDMSDIASDIMKYKCVVDCVIDSGILDDNEELKEKLNTAVDVVDKAQYLRELAIKLEDLGWIEEGGTISKVAMPLLGKAGSILSGVTAASTSASAVAGTAGVIAGASTSSTVAGVVGGAMAGTGAAVAAGGTAGIAGAVATGAVATVAAPFVVGAAVAGVVGYGISKVWSAIWD